MAMENPNQSCKFVHIVLCQIFAIWIMFSICFTSVTPTSSPLWFSCDIWLAILDVIQLHIS